MDPWDEEKCQIPRASNDSSYPTWSHNSPPPRGVEVVVFLASMFKVGPVHAEVSSEISTFSTDSVALACRLQQAPPLLPSSSSASSAPLVAFSSVASKAACLGTSSKGVSRPGGPSGLASDQSLSKQATKSQADFEPKLLNAPPAVCGPTLSSTPASS